MSATHALPNDRSTAQNAPESASGAGAELVSLGDMASILVKRRHVILAGALFAGTLASLYLLVATPLYSASATLLLDPTNRGVLVERAVPTLGTVDAQLVDSQVRLITSDIVLRRVVEKEQLLEEPGFAEVRPRLLTRLLTLFGRAPAPAAERDDKLRIALETLKEAISVRRPERTYVVDLDVRTPDAALSARIANAVARAYLSDQVEFRSDVVRREKAWLETYLLQLQTAAQDAEARVEAYKLENGIFGEKGKLTTDVQVSDINAQLAQARGRTAAARAKLDEANAALRAGRPPEAFPDALRSPVIERLKGQLAEIARVEANARTTLGPKHPAYLETRQQMADTRRLIAEEARRIGEAAKAEFALATANEATLQKQLDAAKAATGPTGQALAKLRELEREADAVRANLERVAKDRELLARSESEGPSARIIAPAVAPIAPAHPKKLGILLLALAGGALLGVAAALIAEQVARGRRAARPIAGHRAADMAAAPDAPQTSTFLTPLAARGPIVFRPPPEGSSLAALRAAPAAPFAQALLGLAAELAETMPAAGDFTTLVAPAGPLADGATAAAVAANLALALADLGMTVLLIDADPVKARLSQGLSDIVAAGETASMGRMRLVYELGTPRPPGRLLLMPAETARGAVLPPAAADLAFAERRRFPNRFDAVILCSGETGLAPETSPLATLADRIVSVEAPRGPDRPQDGSDAPARLGSTPRPGVLTRFLRRLGLRGHRTPDSPPALA